MVFLNPRVRRSRPGVRRVRRSLRRSLPARGPGGHFLPRLRRKAKRRASTSAHKTTMAKTRRRIRRNPPKMTPALRRKIGARIRALHRSGKYKSSARRSPSRRRRRAAALSVSRPASISRRVSRRASRRSVRRSVRRSGGAMLGGGMLGLRSVLNRDNLMMAGGAVAAAFVVQWSHGQILKMVATKDASGKSTLPAGSVWLNPFVTAAIKLGITGLAAKVTSRWSRPVATGMLIGGTVVVINDAIAALTRTTATTSSGTAQYLSQYLGAAPTPGRNVRSLVGPVTPTAATFGTGRVGMNALYGNTAAFSGDAWSR